VGLYRTTPEGRILDANPALVEMLGYPDRASLLATKATDLYIGPGDRERWQALVESEGIVREFEHRLRRCDGTTIWMEDSARVVMDADGRPSYYDGSMKDITAHRQAEEALRQSEAQYDLLFTEMLSAFALHEIIYDENGKPHDYRFLKVNPAFERMTGLQAKDIIGETVRKVLPDIEQYWIERYGHVALSGEPTEFEEYSGDLEKHYEVRAFCPEPGKFATLFHDISARTG